jgi:PAS domain S-box-containing protein
MNQPKESAACNQVSNEELEKWNLIFAKIMDISEDGFLIVDTDSRILEMNRAYLEYLQLSAEDVIGKHIHDVIKNSELPKILKSGITETNVMHKLVKDQSPSHEKYAIVTRAPVWNGAEVIAAVGQVKFSLKTMELANKLQSMDEELQYYRTALERIIGSKYSFETMIGVSKAFSDVKRIAQKASRSEMSVLLTGETGTGKEVFASAIHYSSDRKKQPFIRINCAAIPADLLESELFGYAEGSFTGAMKGGKKGKFELADKGSIFLDEIGDMPLAMQSKILRVLQEKEIEKVGSYATTSVDVRVIAATNKNLEEKVRNKTFREDLYYRLNVINIEIPPLRERVEDIPLFAAYFLKELNKKYKTDIRLSPEVSQKLQEYSWPGNIRELNNIIGRAYSLVDDEIILAAHLPASILTKFHLQSRVSSHRNLNILVDDFEREIIISFLEKNDYNCAKTAEELGIHRTTLYNKIDKLGISLRA